MEDRLKQQRFALAALAGWFAVTAAWWVLALWPVADAPVWLQRTRYVCFGVDASGLPDGGGWIGLIGGPVGMLLILVVGWWRVFSDVVTHARRSIAAAAVLVAVAVGVTLLISGAAWRIRAANAAEISETFAELPPPSTYPRLNMTAPITKLIAQDGRRLDLQSLRGRPVLVTFAFAHCQTICPVIVQQTLQAQQLLRADNIDAAVVIISLDPWRDMPSRLPAMAAEWKLKHDNAWVLSGDVADVEKVLDAWDVPRKRDTRNGMVTHPSLVYIIDANGRIAFASTGGTDNIVTLAKRL